MQLDGVSYMDQSTPSDSLESKIGKKKKGKEIRQPHLTLILRKHYITSHHLNLEV